MATPQPHTPGEDFPGLDDYEYYTTAGDEQSQRLIGSLKITATAGCLSSGRSHVLHRCGCQAKVDALSTRAEKLLISIYFVHEWRQHLLANEHCYSYTDDDQGKATFLAQEGNSVESYARVFAEYHVVPPTILAAKSTLDAVVDAMLGFWAARTTAWRSKYTSHKEACSTEAISHYHDPETHYYLDERDRKLDPHPRLRLSGPLTCIAYGPKDHASQIFLIPMQVNTERGKEGQGIKTRYALLGVLPCHENCSVWKLRLSKRRMSQILVDAGLKTTQPTELAKF